MPTRSAYSGGYSDAIRRQLDSIVIPDKIKCAVCKKIRMRSAFSMRQIDVLRSAMVTEGAKAASGRAYARCRYCVSGQVVELKCSVCDRTKALGDFAKSQRNNRDTARCLACVQRHTETGPVIEEPLLLAEGARIRDTVRLSSQASGRTAADFQKLSLGRSIIDGESLSAGSRVWLEPERETYDGASSIIREESKPVVYSGSQHGRLSDSWKNEAHGYALSLFSSGRLLPQRKESRFARVPASHLDGEKPRVRISEREEDIVGPSDQEGDEGEKDVENFL